MFENASDWLMWALLLGCVLPVIIMAVLGALVFYFGQKWVSDFVEPDLPALQADLAAMRQKNPTVDDDVHIRRIINKQAFKCGIVGAVTGVGGFVTLPVAIPIDLLLTARYQATMVSFIAQVNGYENSIENKAATYAVISGSTELTKLSTAVVRRYAPRILGKTFSKIIPVIGAVIGFVANYAMAQSTARIAKNWYASKTRDEIMGRLGLGSAR